MRRMLWLAVASSACTSHAEELRPVELAEVELPRFAHLPRQRRVPHWVPCTELIGEAPRGARRHLELLCGFTGHGFDRPDNAAACLVERGYGEALFPLVEADNEWARAYARDAIAEADAWTLRWIETSLSDPALSPTSWGVHAALHAALEFDDRAAIEPILARWAEDLHPFVFHEATRERGDEAWISTDRLEFIAADEFLENGVYGALGLALRGNADRADVLYAALESQDGTTRILGLEGLTALGWASVWDSHPELGREGTSTRTAFLALGAQLLPDRAVEVIDASDDREAGKAIAYLPLSLFEPRAVRAVGSIGFFGDHIPRLEQSLGRLPGERRCEVLRAAVDQHGEEIRELLRVHLAEDARDCAIVPPPAPRCDRRHRWR